MSESSFKHACLYVVATPIGNLGDMVPRAIEVLQTVDLIAAEDTRHSKKLMHHFGITTPLVAYHDHSGPEAVADFINRVQRGETLALISDAGTPLVSDPGYRLVDAALDADIQVVPIPGASAAIAALCAAGLPSDRFVFEGFLPAKSAARVKQLEGLEQESRTLIFYEAPHRLLDCVKDLASVFGLERVAVLARELTKTFETIRRAPLGDLHAWIQSDQNQQRGECVLLVQGAKKADNQSLEGRRVFDILAGELPIKQAAALAARITGAKKNALYQYGLEEKAGRHPPEA